MTADRLRVVSWNCNEGLTSVAGKADKLLSLRPDIAVVIECSARVEQVGDLARIGWVGNATRRGLAVFAKPDLGGRVHASHDSTRQFFLPVEFPSVAFRLLAVWAMNYRGTESRPDYGRTHSALGAYEAFLADGDLVVGDFNDNVRWDKPTRRHYSRTADILGALNYSNLYYDRTGEAPGDESIGTLYFHRDPGKPYFIDHAFLRRDRAPDVCEFSVGSRDEWISLSDHVPLVLEVSLPGLRPETSR